MLPHRQTLSVFHAVYEFIEGFGNSKKVRDLWNSVKAEVWVALGLLPLIRAVISRAWWMEAYVSDASTYGGALMETRDTLRELSRVAPWAEMKGWHV